MSTPLSSNGGYLPFSDDLYGNMGKLRALIASTEGSQPLPQDFGAAMEYARADAARRGIQGPLAARMGAEASNDYMNKYSQLRFDRLNQLLGAQSQLGLQLQDREEERRKYMAQLAAQKHAAEQARLSGIFRLGGTLLGGGLGMLGGPAGAAAGAGLGGAFGGALPSMFDTGY